MNHLTVGVAGHIDHGKTALVRALTGTETDRLKEEQERGITIVLGFAHLTLPSGKIDFVDVPGHEKFVKTMIAGATGIDTALLVIAANERVKPQTVEHVALMGLLGVKRGIVAVTKSDLVADPAAREHVLDDLRGFLAGTFLADAPLLFVSAQMGEGIAALQDALTKQLDTAIAPAAQSRFSLPVDRVFTLTGQGTVVTGTLRSGPIRTGQTVEILPGGRLAEVRGLQVHGQPIAIAHPGGRTAVNLRGIKKEDIAHGDTLATPGTLRPTRILDADLTLLASAAKPLRRGQSVTLHYGAAEVPARVYPLGIAEIAPGERAFVQMRLTEDAVLACGEPFVVRQPSPAETLGGGRITDPYPQKHTQADAALLRHIETLASGSPAERLLAKLSEAGPAGRDPAQLLADLGLPAEALSPALPIAVCSPLLVLDQAVFDVLTTQIADAVTQFHAKHPTRRGLPSEELRRSLPPALKPAAYTALLRALSGTIETVDGLVRTPGYSPEAALSSIEREIAREIESQFREGGLKPPELDAVLKRDRRRKTLYYYLVESGALIPTTDRTSNRTVVFHRTAIDALGPLLQAALTESDGGGLRVSELNQVLGTTRKFSVPLLEYLDSLGLTRRDGDLRFWKEDSFP